MTNSHPDILRNIPFERVDRRGSQLPGKYLHGHRRNARRRTRPSNTEVFRVVECPNPDETEDVSDVDPHNGKRVSLVYDPSMGAFRMRWHAMPEIISPSLRVIKRELMAYLMSRDRMEYRELAKEGDPDGEE